MKQKGFTLIEVMVALFITASISLMGWKYLDVLSNSIEFLEKHQASENGLKNMHDQWYLDFDNTYGNSRRLYFYSDGHNGLVIREKNKKVYVIVWGLSSDKKVSRWESALVEGESIKDLFKKGLSIIENKSSNNITSWISSEQLRWFIFKENWTHPASVADSERNSIFVTTSQEVPPPPPKAVRLIIDIDDTSKITWDWHNFKMDMSL